MLNLENVSLVAGVGSFVVRLGAKHIVGEGLHKEFGAHIELVKSHSPMKPLQQNMPRPAVANTLRLMSGAVLGILSTCGINDNTTVSKLYSPSKLGSSRRFSSTASARYLRFLRFLIGGSFETEMTAKCTNVSAGMSMNISSGNVTSLSSLNFPSICLFNVFH